MFRGKLFEDEDLITTKIGETGPRRQYHAPWACLMRLCYLKMPRAHASFYVFLWV